MGRPEEVDLNLIHALKHPLRIKILRVLGEQTASPKMLAQLLREPLNTVSYHVDVLRQYGCVEEVRRERRRGAEEHFYRAKPSASLGAYSWQHVPAALKDHLVGMSLEAFSSRVTQALENGAFEEEGGSEFSWQPITVDERGWQETKAIVEEVNRLFREVAERSRDRLAGTDGIPLVAVVGAVKTGAR